MKIKLFLYLTFFLSTHVVASPPPCSKWEFIIRSHEVQAYEKKDGTKVTRSIKKNFCKNKFPKVESWQERFTDGKIKGWPNETENFKIWTQLEEETVLKYLSEQPAIFRNIPGITFLRGIKSIYDKNPGAAVKRLNAITLYDDFFTSNKKSQILSHELSHIYVYERDREEIVNLVYIMGWREETETKNLIRFTHSPPLKPTSLHDVSEDLANHFEYFLHHPEELNVKSKRASDYIQRLMGKDFKLEK
jgi:hypothetical protein